MKISGAITLIGGAVIALVLPWFSTKPPSIPDPNPDPIELPTPLPVFSPTPIPIPGYTSTVGVGLPTIFDEWWLRSGDKFAILSGPSLMENDDFRTNILIPWSGKLDFNIEYYSKDGIKLGTRQYKTYTLEPCSEDNCSGYLQLNSPMKEIKPEYTDIFSIRCIPIQGDGRLFIFATSIDNRSGDPTMYTQFRFAGNGDVWTESGRYN